MIHPTHRLKAYMGDFQKKLIFCDKCGKEEDEGLEEPCANKFLVREVDKQEERK